MSNTYKLQGQAWRKVLLHAAKNADKPLLGVVLGTIAGTTVTIADAVPLFHTNVMAPMTELAVTMVCGHVEYFCALCCHWRRPGALP